LIGEIEGFESSMFTNGFVIRLKFCEIINKCFCYYKRKIRKEVSENNKKKEKSFRKSKPLTRSKGILKHEREHKNLNEEQKYKKLL